jgi:hypothetical protein
MTVQQEQLEHRVIPDRRVRKDLAVALLELMAHKVIRGTKDL